MFEEMKSLHSKETRKNSEPYRDKISVALPFLYFPFFSKERKKLHSLF